MSAKWNEDDEEFKIEGVKGSFRSKPRFSFNEVKLLLQAVKRNRYIILRKFNQGVSSETKKQTWAEITDQINSLGENHREVRQIMKKWADLKCDGKRRMAALRGPNGNSVRKKKLGPVERMVHKILLLSPQGGGDSDLEPTADDEDFSKFYATAPSSNPSPYSYLSLTDSNHPLQGGASFEFSPLSSPEKELGGEPVHSSSDFDLADEGDRAMDFEDNDDALFSSYPPSAPPPTSLDPLPDNILTRSKPVHTYSRSSQGQNHTQNHTSSSSSSSSRPPPGPSSSVASTSSDFPLVSDSDAAPPPSQSPTGSKVTASSSLAAPPSSLAPPSPASSSPSVTANDATSQPAASSTSIPPPPPASSSSVTASNSHQPPPSFSVLPPNQHPSTSGTNPSDPLPAGASSRRQPDQVAQMASQSLQQQRASRMLLTSVSQSLEVLAQSVQLLVESQQEFVQESLLLQRETVDILKDFSNTALTMLRDKSNSGQLTYHHPSSYF